MFRMKSFSSKIQLIGVNPYVLLPVSVLKHLFEQAGKDKGAIAVKGKLNGKSFIQNLVKYSGKWRLYLNGPMRQAAGIDVGDMANVEIDLSTIHTTNMRTWIRKLSYPKTTHSYFYIAVR